MAGFDLSKILQDSGVQAAETGAKQITYLPLADLLPDPRNEYSIDGIDQLASWIAFDGLQQPLVVVPAEGGKYTVRSGHRRREALLKLAAEDPEKWATVPCIVADSGSPALDELRLIIGNLASREKTNADKTREAERVEALLYELKEQQGIEFPGRMRDYVAQIVGVSKSKLQRLKQIKDGLKAAAYVEAWERGELKESVALELIRFGTEDQELLASALPLPAGLEVWGIRGLQGKDLSAMRMDGTYCAGECRNCTETKHRIRRAYDNPHIASCKGKCCMRCKEDSCAYACSIRAKEMKAARQETKAEKEAKAQADRLRECEQARERLRRIVRAADAAAIDDETTLPNYYGFDGESIGSLRSTLEKAEKDPLAINAAYYAYRIDERRLPTAAQKLHCTTDYLLGLTDDPAPGGAQMGTAAAWPTWQTGTPPREGVYYAKLKTEVGAWARMELSYAHGEWAQREESVPEDWVVGWLPLPQD